MSPVRSVTYVSGMDLIEMVGARGFEPPTARTPSVCASQAALRPEPKGFGRKRPHAGSPVGSAKFIKFLGECHSFSRPPAPQDLRSRESNLCLGRAQEPVWTERLKDQQAHRKHDQGAKKRQDNREARKQPEMHRRPETREKA